MPADPESGRAEQAIHPGPRPATAKMMKRNRRVNCGRLLWAALLLPLLASGCGKGRASMVQVSGTVTWEGQPLEEGDIIFEPLDGRTAAGAGKIVKGAYSFESNAGQKRVQIQATRQTVFNKQMNQYEREAFIPPRYNAHSELAADVRPDGENRFDFELHK
jgi:hypothetical protein